MSTSRRSGFKFGLVIAGIYLILGIISVLILGRCIFSSLSYSNSILGDVCVSVSDSITSGPVGLMLEMLGLADIFAPYLEMYGYTTIMMILIAANTVFFLLVGWLLGIVINNLKSRPNTP